ncbi:MAG TPA: GntR family transcriptional regulator [Sporichthya sp.]|nr:GntR family transcriptional regulator [Sporichthya sp.]
MYLQIADDLRREVQSGRLPVGERLPARRQLSEQYGVAPETIRRSLDELAREGVIATQSTRGTYVIKTPEQIEPSPEYQKVMAEMQRLSERVEDLEIRMQGLEPH